MALCRCTCVGAFICETKVKWHNKGKKKKNLLNREDLPLLRLHCKSSPNFKNGYLKHLRKNLHLYTHPLLTNKAKKVFKWFHTTNILPWIPNSCKCSFLGDSSTLLFQLEDMFQLVITPRGIDDVKVQLKDTHKGKWQKVLSWLYERWS